MRKVSPWPQHAIMLRRTSMGLNNSLIFLHYFMLLWAICCLLSHEPRHNGLFWNKEEINCLLMPRCVPFSYVVGFPLWWCYDLAHVLRHQCEVLQQTKDEREGFGCATGYNKWYCLRCSMDWRTEKKQQWIMTIITSNANDVAHQTCFST